jgi:hypothetical protein
MRAIGLAVLTALALLAPAPEVAGEEPAAPAAPDTAATAQATAASATDAPATTVAKADGEDALHLPPGFKPKKRGKYMLYCRKEEVMGTRFPVERCYDEAGIREFIRAQIENQEQVDQMRRICSTAGACGSN